MSVKAKDLVTDLFAKARRRNPDVFDMYIYDGEQESQNPMRFPLVIADTKTCSEFYAHAVFDLVDKTLATIYSKINRKDYDEAYCMLEGLTVFNQLDSSWLGQ